jgi:hypothetical protein
MYSYPLAIQPRAWREWRGAAGEANRRGDGIGRGEGGRRTEGEDVAFRKRKRK